MNLEAEMRNIRRFGRYARAFCLLLAVPLVLVGPLMLATIVFGSTSAAAIFGLGAEIVSDQVSVVSLKVWAFIVTSARLGIMANGLLHLYRLFGNLASGLVHTRDNVLHIRRLGVLALASAVLQIVVPVLSGLLLGAGVVDAALVTPVSYGVGPDSLSMFIMAGLILLASWIMEVGRQASEEAQELRREGELVI